MRWLLIPLIFMVLFAPANLCQTKSFVKVNNTLEIPPLRFGHPAAFFGTDDAGRDLGCLVSRGVGHSVKLAGLSLIFGFLLGLLLGVFLGIRGTVIALQGELFFLAGLLLFLGIGAYVLVLVLGLTILVARMTSNVVASLSKEVFLEGAKALGGNTWHILQVHYMPHIQVRLPALVASAFGAVLLWMAELAILGFFNAGVFMINLIGGDSPREFFAFPADPDLAQLIAFFRFAWISQPELLGLPMLVLLILNLGFMDLGRWLEKKASKGKRIKHWIDNSST